MPFQKGPCGEGGRVRGFLLPLLEETSVVVLVLLLIFEFFLPLLSHNTKVNKEKNEIGELFFYLFCVVLAILGLRNKKIMSRRQQMRLRLQQKSRSLNLKYASKDLRCDRAVVLTAMINHSGSLIHCLDSDLREEVYIILLFYYFFVFLLFSSTLFPLFKPHDCLILI